mmetsp:Transcript_3463/g.11584  ORF Transcript_3463/g.11584 Transcript_3463/m.11584 type:complete len:235 (+) Transcript_3463:384-1088(+)
MSSLEVLHSDLGTAAGQAGGPSREGFAQSDIQDRPIQSKSTLSSASKSAFDQDGKPAKRVLESRTDVAAGKRRALSQEVARQFGIAEAPCHAHLELSPEVEAALKDDFGIGLVLGPSGSGKSTLLARWFGAEARCVDDCGESGHFGGGDGSDGDADGDHSSGGSSDGTGTGAGSLSPLPSAWPMARRRRQRRGLREVAGTKGPRGRTWASRWRPSRRRHGAPPALDDFVRPRCK